MVASTTTAPVVSGVSLDGDLSPWVDVVGHRDALVRLQTAAEHPVHAYLFVGTPGSGSWPAALGFAGLLLVQASAGRRSQPRTATGDAGEPQGGADSGDRADYLRLIHLARDEKHPDVIVVEPEGATLRVSEAEQIIKAGLRSPVEGSRKVIIVKGVDAIEENAIGKLLKVIEEPPPSTVFVLLAEEVPPELITIASRCVRVDFGPLGEVEIRRALEARGVEPERAASAAAAANGDFGRAELLSTDDSLVHRAALWASIPDRVDGTSSRSVAGSLVVELVDEIRNVLDGAQGPLEARQQRELEELEKRVEQTGERGSGRSDLVARHKREVRRQRSDELRFGFAVLARVYRDRLLQADDPAAYEAVKLIQAATENMVRNPNEALQLQNLLLKLGGSGR